MTEWECGEGRVIQTQEQTPCLGHPVGANREIGVAGLAANVWLPWSRLRSIEGCKVLMFAEIFHAGIAHDGDDGGVRAKLSG